MKPGASSITNFSDDYKILAVTIGGVGLSLICASFCILNKPIYHRFSTYE